MNEYSWVCTGYCYSIYYSRLVGVYGRPTVIKCNYYYYIKQYVNAVVKSFEMYDPNLNLFASS